MSSPIQISDQEAQSLRVRAGKNLEKNVSYAITELLARTDSIFASSLKDLKIAAKKDPRLLEILDYARTPLHCPCTQSYEMILPDTDVVAYYLHTDINGKVQKRFHLATISCKVSFHSRYSEATFWASVLKGNGRKSVLVTEDKDNELGMCEKGNKTRRVLENFMDEIYLIKQYGKGRNDLIADIGKFYDRYIRSGGTSYHSPQQAYIFDQGRTDRYCRQVRAFDDLLYDLRKWKLDCLKV